jgi:hypothetical protein
MLIFQHRIRNGFNLSTKLRSEVVYKNLYETVLTVILHKLTVIPDLLIFSSFSFVIRDLLQIPNKKSNTQYDQNITVIF